MSDQDMKEIDLNQDWYCPFCKGETKLVLNDSKDCLYCPTHESICDYEYHTAKGLEIYKVVLPENFKKPRVASLTGNPELNK